MFSQIEIRPLKLEDLSTIYQLDRSEEVRRSYLHEGGALIAKEENVTIINDDDFWDGHIGNWQEAIEKNAVAFAAYDKDKLAGFAIMSMDVEARATQILALYVDTDHRLSGIAKSLYLEMFDASKSANKETLYVAATPTESAVRFYLSQGFEVLKGKNRNLLYLQDGDIHMSKRI
ncbi:GNAT family N-acetyltransferase [Puniceicoccaceae bacterium K14]|nr:GNAT family N-acetyltransferase [Puniceicoccaceae bacterium K14]